MNIIDTAIQYIGFGLAGGLSLATYDYLLSMSGLDLSTNLPDFAKAYVRGSGDVKQSFMKGALTGVMIPFVADTIGLARISPGRLITSAQRLI